MAAQQYRAAHGGVGFFSPLIPSIREDDPQLTSR